MLHVVFNLFLQTTIFVDIIEKVDITRLTRLWFLNPIQATGILCSFIFKPNNF